nr:MAG TPA: hypothetical protein [Bacteriophage sp.]
MDKIQLKLKLSSKQNIKGNVSSKENIKGNISMGTNNIGITFKQMLDAISTSGDITNKKAETTIDISGEKLKTGALTNFDIEEILKK